MPPDRRSAIREALDLVRSAARSDYLGFPESAEDKMERATTLLEEAFSGSSIRERKT